MFVLLASQKSSVPPLTLPDESASLNSPKLDRYLPTKGRNMTELETAMKHLEALEVASVRTLRISLVDIGSERKALIRQINNARTFLAPRAQSISDQDHLRLFDAYLKILATSDDPFDVQDIREAMRCHVGK